MIFYIALLIVATLCMITYVALIFTANEDDYGIARYNKILTDYSRVSTLQKKGTTRSAKLSHYSGIVYVIMKVFCNGNFDKVISKLQNNISKLRTGSNSGVNIFVLPGYVIQRIMPTLRMGNMYKNIVVLNLELFGKKHAENKSRHLLASIISLILLGLSANIAVSLALLASGATNVGLAFLGVGSILVVFVAYAMYDEISDKVKKRRERISQQVPNIVTKLALLVSSGMIVPEAWKQTGYSHDDDLYIEMRRTSDEMDQSIAPDVAYENFINRCNTKETSKLASTIMQNLTKGNAEIADALQVMAKESWQERRHMAKRNAEKANSKLMIPTMLIFLSILIIIMVPIAMSFGSF